MLGIDLFWRLASSIWLGARITAAEYDADSTTTWLRLSAPRAAVTGAGDYYCLAVPGIRSWLSHPFSVATSRDGELLFLDGAFQFVGGAGNGLVHGGILQIKVNEQGIIEDAKLRPMVAVRQSLPAPWRPSG